VLDLNPGRFTLLQADVDGAGVACAKRVFIALEHSIRDGKPRLLKRCTLPITAPGAVKLMATDLGLCEVTLQGFLLQEHVLV